METNTSNQLISTGKVAGLLGIRKTTLANWRSTGSVDLPHVKIGSRVMYREVDIDAFVERNIRRQAGGAS